MSKGRAWPSSPACTWHCSLHYLFLQRTAWMNNIKTWTGLSVEEAITITEDRHKLIR